MNNKILIGILGFTFLLKTYGQDIYFVIYQTSPELSHFNSFIDEEKIKPLKKINYYSDRVYSHDKNHYLLSTERNNTLKLKDKSGNLITEIKDVSFKDMIFWLKNCVIIDKFYTDHTKKIAINLTTGDTKIYTTTDKFRFVGQTDSLCFFYTIADYSEIDSLFLLSRQSLISMNEHGVKVEYKNPTVKGRELKKSNYSGKEEWAYTFSDTVITFDYYNRQFSTGSNSFGNTLATRYFKHYDSIWVYPDKVPFFDMDCDAYYSNGYTYALINNQFIFSFGKNEVQKVIECENLKIDRFEVYNQYLVFSSLKNPNKPIGILNFKTKKIKYPKLIEK